MCSLRQPAHEVFRVAPAPTLICLSAASVHHRLAHTAQFVFQAALKRSPTILSLASVHHPLARSALLEFRDAHKQMLPAQLSITDVDHLLARSPLLGFQDARKQMAAQLQLDRVHRRLVLRAPFAPQATPTPLRAQMFHANPHHLRVLQAPFSLLRADAERRPSMKPSVKPSVRPSVKLSVKLFRLHRTKLIPDLIFKKPWMKWRSTEISRVSHRRSPTNHSLLLRWTPPIWQSVDLPLRRLLLPLPFPR